MIIFQFPDPHTHLTLTNGNKFLLHCFQITGCTGFACFGGRGEERGGMITGPTATLNRVNQTEREGELRTITNSYSSQFAVFFFSSILLSRTRS